MATYPPDLFIQYIMFRQQHSRENDLCKKDLMLRGTLTAVINGLCFAEAYVRGPFNSCCRILFHLIL